MRVWFEVATIPTWAAKRIKKLLAVKESHARELTAYVLGYANWHELLQQLGAQPASPLDEDLSPAERLQRRDYQLQRLLRHGHGKLLPTLAKLPTAAGTVGDTSAKMFALLATWQPSARHPATTPQQRHKAAMWLRHRDGSPLALTELLPMAHSAASVADGTAADEIDQMVTALIDASKRETDTRALDDAVLFASTLLRHGQRAPRLMALRLLTSLLERRPALAAQHLAAWLLIGCAVPSERARGTKLLRRVLPHFQHEPANTLRVAMGLPPAGLELAANSSPETLAHYEAVARSGNGLAAYCAALYYDDTSACAGQVDADAERAADLYFQGTRGRYNGPAIRLAALLLRNSWLERFPDEPLYHLQRLADRGDAFASLLLHNSGAADAIAAATTQGNTLLGPAPRDPTLITADEMQELLRHPMG